MPKPRDADDVGTDIARADHTQRLALKVETFQPIQCETARACALHRLGQPVTDSEQQSKHVLGHGVLAIGRKVADGDTVLGAVSRVDMVVAGGPGGDQLERRKLFQRVAPVLRINESRDNLGVRELHDIVGSQWHFRQHKFVTAPKTLKSVRFTRLFFEDNNFHMTPPSRTRVYLA